MSTHTSTKKRLTVAAAATEHYESLTRFGELLNLRSLAVTTQADGARKRGDGQGYRMLGPQAALGRGGADAGARIAGRTGHNACAICKLAESVERDPAELDDGAR